MASETPDTGPASTGLEATLSDGYATVHELETRTLQLERHCDALLARGADAEQMRARRALHGELEALRTSLERLRVTES